MLEQPSKELSLTKMEIRTINLMLIDILDYDYDRIGEMSFQEIFDLIESGQIFSIFEKYKESVPLVFQMFDYYSERTLKSKEFSYIILNFSALRPELHDVYKKGFTYLLEICLDLYVKYDFHKASYNGERTEPYRFPYQVGKFLHVCNKAFEPVSKLIGSGKEKSIFLSKVLIQNTRSLFCGMP